YLAASRRYLTDYRLSDQAVLGRSHYEIFPEISARWKQIHQRCLAGAVESCDETPFRARTGRWTGSAGRSTPGTIIRAPSAGSSSFQR
ncbi:MAG: hypothetical protein IH586_00925, partial [Anaerolineaceae bacterium]|nr:hypothetical protein [Anaerolineaceae bacterium]